MKNLFFLLIVISACSQPAKDLSESAAREIWAADSTMAALSAKEGFNNALLAFAADDVVKPMEGQLPIVGKQALKDSFKGEAGTKDVVWGPFTAKASASGDLGYTLGNWKYATADTTKYGFYYTMWKKQADGTWKWTVDGENNMPGKFEMK